MPIGTILIDLRDESFIFTELLYLNDNEVDSIFRNQKYIIYVKLRKNEVIYLIQLMYFIKNYCTIIYLIIGETKF